MVPVPQENRIFVEQAGQPVADNGARCQIKNTVRSQDFSPYKLF